MKLLTILILLIASSNVLATDIIFRCGNTYQYEECDNPDRMLDYTPMTKKQIKKAKKLQIKLNEYTKDQQNLLNENQKLIENHNAIFAIANAVNRLASYQQAQSAMIMKNSQIYDNGIVKHTNRKNIVRRTDDIANRAILR
jgi:CRISPR/Cas system CSM-associated protein Csm4 (group 5 of RAMP superfamily)